MGVQEFLSAIDRRDHDYCGGPGEERGRMEVRDQRILGSAAPGLRGEVGRRHSFHVRDRSRERTSRLRDLRASRGSRQRPESELGVRDALDLVRDRQCVRATPEDAGRRDRAGPSGGRRNLLLGLECLRESAVPEPQLGRVHHPVERDGPEGQRGEFPTRLDGGATGRWRGSSSTTPWQYIGFVQVIPSGFWVTNLNNPYNSATTFSPYRATRAQFNNLGGELFHLKMSDHGNRTIFFDGFTAITFEGTSGRAAPLCSATVGTPCSTFIVKPVDPTKAANAGGLVVYPGSAVTPTTFAYAALVDIKPSNQDGGGLPSEVFLAAENPFQINWPQPFTNAGTYKVTIIVSGIAGPAGMTYGAILTRWGATYNPYDHLNDADLTTRTLWYSQLIDYASIAVYT